MLPNLDGAWKGTKSKKVKKERKSLINAVGVSFDGSAILLGKELNVKKKRKKAAKVVIISGNAPLQKLQDGALVFGTVIIDSWIHKRNEWSTIFKHK